MQVHLKYGRDGLTVDVPDDATVLQPKEVAGLPDEPLPCASASAPPTRW